MKLQKIFALLMIVFLLALPTVAVMAQDETPPPTPLPASSEGEQVVATTEEAVATDEAGEIPTLAVEPTVDPVVDEGEQTLIREIVMPFLRETFVPAIERFVIPLSIVAAVAIIGVCTVLGISVRKLGDSKPANEAITTVGTGVVNLARLTPGDADDKQAAELLRQMGYRVEKTASGWLKVIRDVPDEAVS